MPPVLVFINAPDSLSMKVDTVKLRIEIELRLRQNHIRVVEQSETRGKTVAVMTVVVETMAVNNDTEWMYVHEISVEELTQIARKPKPVSAFAMLWSFPPSIGYIGRGLDFGDLVRKSILDTLDIFINDYLAANAKR